MLLHHLIALVLFWWLCSTFWCSFDFIYVHLTTMGRHDDLVCNIVYLDSFLRVDAFWAIKALDSNLVCW